MNNSGFRSFMKKLSNSNVFWAVVSFFIAVMFWGYVSSTEGTATERTLNGIKVEFLGEEQLRDSSGLAVINQDTTTVSVTVSGARRYISRLNVNNVTAQVNLSNVTTDGRYTIAYDLSYPTGVNSDEISIVRSNTDVITFTVDKIISKSIDVLGEFSGTLADGYMIKDSMVIDPLSVKISGPKTIVNNVDHGLISISRTDLASSLTFDSTYELVSESGEILDSSDITFETELVNVYLKVLAVKEVPLDINLIDSNSASREANASVTIEPSTVKIIGESTIIDNISKITLGSLSLTEFGINYSSKYNIIPPDGTELLDDVSEAQVDISLSGVSTKAFVINKNCLSCSNIPENVNAKIVTTSLVIELRGEQEILNQITTANIHGIADLSEYSESGKGVYTPAIKITVDGFDNIDAVGEHYIYVRLE